jgi:hypothetical protein
MRKIIYSFLSVQGNEVEAKGNGRKQSGILKFFCSFQSPNKTQIQIFMIEFLRKTLSLSWGLAEVYFHIV